MHGRKKSDLPQTKEEKDAVQSKISNYKKASGRNKERERRLQFLEQLHSCFSKLRMAATAAAASAACVLSNP